MKYSRESCATEENIWRKFTHSYGISLAKITLEARTPNKFALGSFEKYQS
jgi:hypothetical protein